MQDIREDRSYGIEDLKIWERIVVDQVMNLWQDNVVEVDVEGEGEGDVGIVDFWAFD